MFTVPALEYEYDALEDAISAEIMELHHNKHHQTYVDKLNQALKSHSELQTKPIEELLRHLEDVPEDIRTAVRNNGGGHYNHSLFWRWMSPQGGGQPEGELLQAINDRYGSFDAFVETFNEKALGLFGSGWVWLQPNLDIITTANQDSPLSQGLPEALLGLDVWEHAYYLDYKNHRDEYVKNWWRVVNWPVVQERYEHLRG
ncbi:superoxide dismutase [Candidatus Saccharibacteria bacterium 47-87]|nr:superoxide dismutase [Candidatus Saccharibacteria bacterium]OJU96702.1 MAG: superoxide dismutase [Candidatus Saccharibacteria bacterium 47-87]